MKTLSQLTVSALVLVAIAALGPQARPASASTTLNDGVWSALDTAATRPIARREYAAVYDDVANRMVIFGGAGFAAPDPSSLIGETWSLSLGDTPAWEQIVTAGPMPGERHSPQWGYDAARRRLLIFGGYGRHYPDGPLEYLNDVWELSLEGTPHWTELFPTGVAPAGRLAGVAVYDPLRQRFIGFGGTAGLPVDTWVLNLSDEPAWSTVATDSTGPSGSYGMTSVFDPVRNRMLVFGGSTSDSYYGVQNTTWQLSLAGTPTWKQLAPAGTPPDGLPSGRRALTSVYDPLRDRMVIYGGWDGGYTGAAFLGEAWALELAGDPMWSKLAPAGPTPTQRDAMSAIYDPTHDRLAVYGGWSGTSMLDDTHFLTWGGEGTAASMAASTSAQPGSVQVQWNVQNATGPYVAVYRRQPGTPWSSVATRTSGPAGTVLFDDATVQPGQRYGYQLVVPSERGPKFGGEIWVTVPTSADIVTGASPAFALKGVSPNPVVDRFNVSFTLPGAASARVQLLDVAGRSVVDQEVGSLGAGTHTVQLNGARDFRPGVYFVRLAQGSQSQSRRVVVQGFAR